MKSTGIIRRIDDLGRVVIPKEIRRVMRIAEGDPLEIIITDEGVLLKRYDSSVTILDVLKELTGIVSDSTELDCRSVMLEKIEELTMTLKAEQKKHANTANNAEV